MRRRRIVSLIKHVVSLHSQSHFHFSTNTPNAIFPHLCLFLFLGLLTQIFELSSTSIWTPCDDSFITTI
ncbi:hypothetical protein L1987_61707 [Smallanthus sonchifolius]|uniref:Uncharacterized protein n=1 Tax=Smallanthus sonchifolius TaxID=185202 RepID=A0ACB9C8D9_9ASTR|nr:hypothetical protein L1987_61707 [Smallanthus sonchifolius]